MGEVDDRRNCQICSEELAKYVCPRCGIPYCSLKCYKDERKHVKCSESFYKDCVMEGLRTQEVKDPEGAKKMTQALQRFHEEYDGDDGIDDDGPLDSDDDEPLEKRMDGIDLDDADEIWVNLTEEERAEFKKFAQDVNVNDVVPEWVPWWAVKPERKLVQEITKDAHIQIPNSTSNKVHKDQPDILNPIPLMSSLTKIRPNEHVKVGLTNVIAAYVWTIRLYNGEFLTYENSEEIAGAFISLTSFLGKDTILPNFEHALADVSMNACRSPELFDGGPALQESLSKDVFSILSGHTEPFPHGETLNKKSYVLSVLTECFKLLTKAIALQKSKSSESKSAETPIISKSQSQDKLRPKKPKKMVEEIDDNPTPSGSSLQNRTDNRDDIEDSDRVPVCFEKEFVNPRSFCIEPKVLIKAKRKLHYLLAFANEFDVL